MHYFSYGVVAEQYNSNIILGRGLDVISKNAWVKGALYDSDLGFYVMSYGENKVPGMLFWADEAAMDAIRGLVKNFEALNPTYEFVLKPVVVHTETVIFQAQTFMYENIEGLQEI
jgi:gamma-glutamylcyclotransferase (GGCT)/AIG2-like uncharacterized protein YtfP